MKKVLKNLGSPQKIGKMDFKIMCDSDDKNAKNPGNIPELL